MRADTPLAAPLALWDVGERRLEAVYVVRDVALVAQQQTRLVARASAAFA